MNTDIQRTNGGNGAVKPALAETALENTAAANPNPHAGTEAAARIVHDFVDRVAKLAGQSEEKLRTYSTNAETSIKQSLDTARVKSTAVKTSVTGFIEEHPFAALGIAFGTGVLLSYLTRGSRVTSDDTDA